MGNKYYNKITYKFIKDNSFSWRIILPIGIFIITLLNILMFWINRYDNTSIKLFFIAQSVIILGGIVVYLLHKISDLVTPMYISWNKNKINIINKSGTKEVISWNDINEIKWLGEYHPSGKKYPEYLISLRGRMFPNRYVSPEIGKQLKKIFEKYRKTGKLKEIPRTDIPFYKTIKGGILILALTFFSIFFGAILAVIYLL